MAQSGPHPKTGNTSKARFGTFVGVFVPNFLTIIGLVYFLLIGKVIGNVGLMAALIIVAMANALTFLTGLSLSAVATSMQVGSGGPYYMLARTLGLEVGGAIGVPLFLSQAISVAFYIIGFATGVQEFLWPEVDVRLLSLGTGAFFIGLAWFGADFALKLQYFVLAALGLAILSFYLGGWDSIQSPVWLSPRQHLLDAGIPEDQIFSFWQTFAVFFPAVTGIAVGASMSGDLKDPSKSIPKGTIWSIVVTSVIYLTTTLWLGMHGSPAELFTNQGLMQEIAILPELKLILIGVIAATLSSALGSILAAPRTLQALAIDRVAPQVLGSQLGSPTEPRAAVLVTGAVVMAFLMLGELTSVASMLTLFFLNTYAMLNLAAGVEKLVGNPSYRPKFNVHWGLSLAGAFGCYGAMFLIDALLTMVAIAVSFGVFFWLERRRLEKDWGDVRSGAWFTMARHALLKLESTKLHPKNWRPNILVFVGRPINREHLMEMGAWLAQGRGVVTYVQMFTGEHEQLAAMGVRQSAQHFMRDYIQEKGIAAFSQVQITDNFNSGVLHVAQAHGMAGLEPNAVLLGWHHNVEGRVQQISLMRKLALLGKTVMLLHYDKEQGYGNRRQIDVWWRGRDRNAELMLLMAHIIANTRSWQGARLRLLQVVDDRNAIGRTEDHLYKMLEDVRVKAEPVVAVRESQAQPVSDVITSYSKASDLTFLGMGLPEPQAYSTYAGWLEDMSQRLGSVVFVRSAEVADLLNVSNA